MKQKPVLFISNFINTELSYTPWEKLEARVMEVFSDRDKQARAFIAYYEKKKEFLEEIKMYLTFSLSFDDKELAELFIADNINGCLPSDFISNIELNVLLQYWLNKQDKEELLKYKNSGESFKNNILNYALDLLPDIAEEVETIIFEDHSEDKIKDLIYELETEEVINLLKDSKSISKMEPHFYIWMLKFKDDLFSDNLKFREGALSSFVDKALEEQSQQHSLDLIEFLVKNKKEEHLDNSKDIIKYREKPLLVALLFLKNVYPMDSLFDYYEKLLNYKSNSFLTTLSYILDQRDDMVKEEVFSKILQHCSSRRDFLYKRISNFMKDKYSMYHAKEGSVSKEFPEVARRIKALNANFVFYSNNELDLYLNNLKDEKQKNKRIKVLLEEYNSEISSLKKYIREEYPHYSDIPNLDAIYRRMEQDAEKLHKFLKKDNPEWHSVKGQIFGEWSHFVDDNIREAGQLKQLLQESLGINLNFPKEIDGFSYEIKGDNVTFNFREYKTLLAPIFLSALPDSHFVGLKHRVSTTEQVMEELSSYNLKDTKIEGKKIHFNSELHAMGGVSSRLTEGVGEHYSQIMGPIFNADVDAKNGEDIFFKRFLTVFRKAVDNMDKDVRINSSSYVDMLKDEIYNFSRSLEGLIHESSYDNKKMDEVISEVNAKVVTPLQNERGFMKAKEPIIHIIRKLNTTILNMHKVKKMKY